jgi:hypothetical protein
MVNLFVAFARSHEMPTDPNDPLAHQNIKDRYYGTNDPVADKILRRADGRTLLRLLAILQRCMTCHLFYSDSKRLRFRAIHPLTSLLRRCFWEMLLQTSLSKIFGTKASFFFFLLWFNISAHETHKFALVLELFSL